MHMIFCWAEKTILKNSAFYSRSFPFLHAFPSTPILWLPKRQSFCIQRTYVMKERDIFIKSRANRCAVLYTDLTWKCIFWLNTYLISIFNRYDEKLIVRFRDYFKCAIHKVSSLAGGDFHFDEFNRTNWSKDLIREFFINLSMNKKPIFIYQVVSIIGQNFRLVECIFHCFMPLR